MYWSHRKYHLNAILLLLPVVFLGDFLSGWEAGPHGDVLQLPEQTVGAWRAQAYSERPLMLEPGSELDFHVRFSGDSLAHLRAAFLSIDEAPPPRRRLFEIGYSAALHGGKPLLEAHVPTPRRPSGRESLWLTAEAWDGAVHQVSWPLPPGHP